MERFWSKVDRSAGENACWPWVGTVSNGYGKFWLDGRPQWAHRVALSLHLGRPLAGQALHSCPDGDNPLCCNPSHLREGTSQDNSQDAKERGQVASGVLNVNGRKTHCPKGHLYAGDNLILIRWSGKRRCRECYNAYRRRLNRGRNQTV